MTENMKIALAALRSYQESTPVEGWGTVYLDNAIPSDWSGRKWAGTLSSLAKVGLYEEIDDPDFKGDFGNVKMED